ncbi:MAG: SRPBCC domain-containing protein [Pseudomonadota bacterium]|jgi:uncharacterized protein YndB with AHSA1/START domain
MPNQTTTEAAAQSFSRVFDAPRALVWKAWTTPEYVMQWWGPKGFTCPLCRIDLRIGGRFTYAMATPDGHIGYNGGEFRDIVLLERIVWLWHFADADGNRVSPANYGLPHEDRAGNIDEIRFEQDSNGQTKLTYTRNDPTASQEEKDGVAAAFEQIFDKLATVIAELAHTA